MKDTIKYILYTAGLLIPLFVITFVIAHFFSNAYLFNKYYSFAINNYSGVSNYVISDEDGIGIALINNERYYSISNYDDVLNKYKGNAKKEYKEYSGVINYGGSYYINEKFGNSLSGYTGEYDYKVIESSSSKRSYEVTSYFCIIDDVAIDCDVDSKEGIYESKGKLTIERKGFTWKISEFVPPKENPAYIFDLDEEDSYGNVDYDIYADDIMDDDFDLSGEIMEEFNDDIE